MAEHAVIVARLDHVGLAVADLEAAASWFCDVFGLVPSCRSGYGHGVRRR